MRKFRVATDAVQWARAKLCILHVPERHVKARFVERSKLDEEERLPRPARVSTHRWAPRNLLEPAVGREGRGVTTGNTAGCRCLGIHGRWGRSTGKGKLGKVRRRCHRAGD